MILQVSSKMKVALNIDENNIFVARGESEIDVPDAILESVKERLKDHDISFKLKENAQSDDKQSSEPKDAQQEAYREELLSQAKELGLTFAWNIGNQKLEAMITKAKESQLEPVQNVGDKQSSEPSEPKQPDPSNADINNA